MITQAKKEANKRYMDKQSRITIWCSSDFKEKIEKQAAKSGKSVNAFLKNLIEKNIDSGK